MNSSAGKPVWGFSTAGRIFFGWGAVSELRGVAPQFGKRAFVCTDQNMVKAGISGKVVALLREGGSEIHLFDQGQPEIDRATIEKAAAVAQSYKPDVVVGV